MGLRGKSVGWGLDRILARLAVLAENLGFRRAAPKGASVFDRLAVSLKRYPDTNLTWYEPHFDFIT
jgi:hypothetical protein